MPWRETDAMRERVEFVVEALDPERVVPISELCRRRGISRKTAYKWLNRYRAEGTVTALRERSRRPRRSPARTPAPIEERVVELRLRTGWGGRNLAALLEREGVTLAPRTIDRIIRRRGLIQPDDEPKPVATSRFERSRPNELWQMDYKGPVGLRSGGPCLPLSVLDDHSRYVVGLHALTTTQLAPARQALVTCFERYGVPEAMLMDHGTPWWSTTNGHGLTQLAVFLIRQGIRLIYGRIAHPQTQGKVERFHRSLKRHLAWNGVPEDLADCARVLRSYRELYNHHKPHDGLERAVPASRYRPSDRPYRPEPERWDYPAGIPVRRLNTQGCLDYAGHRFFVCEALAGEWVACQRFDHNRVLVAYRHMHIRELHLDGRRSLPLVRPVEAH